MSEATRSNYAGFQVGDAVICNGYPGTVTRLCEWSNMLVEVRVPGGVVCVDAGELIRVTN